MIRPCHTIGASILSNIDIRLLVDADQAAWYTLWQQYLDFYQTRLPENISNHTWQRLLNHPQMHGWGAFDISGSLLALAHAVQHPNTWHIGECLYLEDLFVLPQARRCGIARRLIETVYAHAAVGGCNRVYWVTNRGNRAAQALYRQLAQQSDVVLFRHDLPQ